jgi:hypothetical protein
MEKQLLVVDIAGEVLFLQWSNHSVYFEMGYRLITEIWTKYSSSYIYLYTQLERGEGRVYL